jgi:hypothetical protein
MRKDVIYTGDGVLCPHIPKLTPYRNSRWRKRLMLVGYSLAMWETSSPKWVNREWVVADHSGHVMEHFDFEHDAIDFMKSSKDRDCLRLGWGYGANGYQETNRRMEELGILLTDEGEITKHLASVERVIEGVDTVRSSLLTHRMSMVEMYSSDALKDSSRLKQEMFGADTLLMECMRTLTNVRKVLAEEYEEVVTVGG